MKKGVFFLMMAALMMPFATRAQFNSSVHIDTTVVACDSYTWSITGDTYTTSGVRTQVSGDTLYILDLVIGHTTDETLTTPVQGGCTYSLGDSVYNTPGNKVHTFQSVEGCDSIVRFNLVLDTTAIRSYTVTKCASYTWKGNTYETSGTYHDTSTVGNCDSILTLNLTIITPAQIDTNFDISGCERVSVPGFNKPFRADTTVFRRYSFRTVEKCYDSTLYYHVTVKMPVYENHVESACDNYSVMIGDSLHVFTHSVVDTIKAPKATNGCDSNYILRLTINKSPEITITGDLRVTPGSDAVLYANSDQNVAYLWYNNSTAESITLTNVTGNVDVWLTGTNNNTGCSHTSYVTVMANAAIGDVDNDMLSIYPNPTSSVININAEGQVKNVSIFNLMGQQVINANNSTSIDLSVLGNGSYVVRVELENGTVATRTVILSK
ncbi:MAG: T9SS type A sorting domain-containing protein [Bacteroidales bacterium]|nr:T9SS type A sorting domain-containing protein [Bacteroidales bacterium]